MKMITAFAAASMIALSSVAYAGGPTNIKKEDPPAAPIVPQSSSAPLVGSFGAGGAAAAAAIAGLALVAALTGAGDNTTSTTGTDSGN